MGDRRAPRVIFALAASIGAWACNPMPAARSLEFFTANPAEARKVVEQCAKGVATGPECATAAVAVERQKANATFDNAIKTSTRKKQINRNW